MGCWYGIMSKRSIVVLLIVFYTIGPILANEPEDVIPGNEIQKKIIRGLENNIARYHKDLHKYYKHLKQAGLVQKNRTRIPILSEQQTSYGVKDRYVYSSEGVLHWSEQGDLLYVHIRERDALHNTFNQRKREWMGLLLQDGHSEDTPVGGYAVDLVTYQVLENGNTDVVNYRVNTALDLKGQKKFPGSPELDVTPRPRITFVTSARKRIKVLRDYYKLITALEHRVRYFTRAIRGGDEMRLEFALPAKR